MFNRDRFCFLNASGFSEGGGGFEKSGRVEKYQPFDHRFTGITLEATLCTDKVWRVLDCEAVAQLAFDENGVN